MMTIAVIVVVLFIGWQFKLLQKYALKYDKFKISTQDKYVSVNGQIIYFGDIDYATVRELEQPALLEKAFSKSAFYTYMTELVFYLKSGAVVHCTFNYKGSLYKALKQLEPFVQIRHNNIEIYKPHIRWVRLLLLLAGIIVVLLLQWT